MTRIRLKVLKLGYGEILPFWQKATNGRPNSALCTAEEESDKGDKLQAILTASCSCSFRFTDAHESTSVQSHAS